MSLKRNIVKWSYPMAIAPLAIVGAFFVVAWGSAGSEDSHVQELLQALKNSAPALAHTLVVASSVLGHVLLVRVAARAARNDRWRGPTYAALIADMVSVLLLVLIVAKAGEDVPAMMVV